MRSTLGKNLSGICGSGWNSSSLKQRLVLVLGLGLGLRLGFEREQLLILIPLLLYPQQMKMVVSECHIQRNPKIQVVHSDSTYIHIILCNMLKKVS